MISDYISKIIPHKLTATENKDKCILIFCGDGEGDFQERSAEATPECVKSYIVSCMIQIKLAEEWLKNKGV